MTASVAIVQFPGSNCERETQAAFAHYGFDTRLVRWNDPQEAVLSAGMVVLPGGFSYQDRVRAGAIAAKLPVFEAIRAMAERGSPVLGICNGCQILAESGLLDGSASSSQVALAPNRIADRALGFVCDFVYVRVEQPQHCVFTRYYEQGEVLPVAINHAEGRFVMDPVFESRIGTLSHLSYCDASGRCTPQSNPNGSTGNLAGVSTLGGTVMAMMPHPERAAFVHQLPLWVSWNQPKSPWEKWFVSLKEHLC